MDISGVLRKFTWFLFLSPFRDFLKILTAIPFTASWLVNALQKDSFTPYL
jgi:hypothetical protein